MLINNVAPILVEQYFDLLSIAYRQRNNIFKSYQHNLKDLTDWDKRMSNYLDGLLLLPKYTEAYFSEKMSEAVLSRGDVFVICLYAATMNRNELIHSILTLIKFTKTYDEVIKDIVLWVPAKSSFWSILPHYPDYHIYALFVRKDINISTNVDERNLSKLGASFLTKELLFFIYHSNSKFYYELLNKYVGLPEVAKITVVESLLQLNIPYFNEQQLKKELYQLTQSSHSIVAENAAKILVIMAPFPVQDYLYFLKNEMQSYRFYIKVLGWYGSVQFMPELIEFLDNPYLARLSAAAIHTITGASLEQEGWTGRNQLEGQPILKDELGFPIEDPDSGLSWPDKISFERWWGCNYANFNQESCYLAGNEVNNIEALSSVIMRTSLPLASLAAYRLINLNSQLSTFMFSPTHRWNNSLITDKSK